LFHAAIRNSAKEGEGALHQAKDLILVTTDVGTQPQTSIEDIKALLTPSRDISTSETELLNAHDPNTGLSDAIAPKTVWLGTTTDWLAFLTPREETRHKKHTGVSQDPRYSLRSSEGDKECTRAPTRIPDKVMSFQTQECIFKSGHGTAPDLIYAMGIPDIPAPDPTTFDCKMCNRILIEVGFCGEFRCHAKLQEKINR